MIIRVQQPYHHQFLHHREINRVGLTRKHKHIFCWTSLHHHCPHWLTGKCKNIFCRNQFTPHNLLPTYILLLVLHHPEEEETASGKDHSVRFRIWRSSQHFVAIFVPACQTVLKHAPYMYLIPNEKATHHPDPQKCHADFWPGNVWSCLILKKYANNGG